MEPLVGPVLGLLGGLTSTLFNFGSQAAQAQKQDKLNQQVMAREDNAVQRRVADLQAAGLSPVLAAGSAASAHPVQAPQAPQVDSSAVMAPMLQALQLMQSMKQMEKTDAEIALTNATRERTETDRVAQEMANEVFLKTAGFQVDESEQRLRQIRIQNDFAEAMNPVALERERQQIRNLSAQEVQTQIQTEHERQKVLLTQAETQGVNLRNLYQAFENQLRKQFGESTESQRLMALRLGNDLAEQQITLTNREIRGREAWDRWKRSGVEPKDFRLEFEQFENQLKAQIIQMINQTAGTAINGARPFIGMGRGGSQ